MSVAGRLGLGRGLGRGGSDGLGGLDGLGGQAGLTFLGLHRRLAAGLGLLLGPLASASGSRRGRRRGRSSAAAATGIDEAALLDGVGDDAAQQIAGPDGVVVAGDHVLDDVGVAVGVDDGHDRHPELVGLGDGDVLLLRVDHEDGVGKSIHAADAAEVALELLELAAQDERFLLRHGLEVAGGQHALVLEHLLHPTADGLEVGEHAAEPALVDVGHAALVGVAGDRVLGLLLRPDEQDRPAVGDEVPHERVGRLDPRRASGCRSMM